MASLQDQLLKAGVVDNKKVKQIKHEKHKQTKQQARGSGAVDETKELAKRALAEKAARDREINLQRQAAAEQKAIQAQITQLIATNRIERHHGDVAYQFSDDKKIKKLYVTESLHKQLGKGQIAIARLGESYELIPAAVAEKIKQRDKNRIIVHNMMSAETAAEDDPYAEYQIPDDLMW
ncbi:MAG: DUF2058 domain-containing protein [Porticoccaceae bacterium]|nr:DUF2058 domain-containing protein [Porticoccaceae bacterium]